MVIDAVRPVGLGACRFNVHARIRSRNSARRVSGLALALALEVTAPTLADSVITTEARPSSLCGRIPPRPLAGGAGRRVPGVPGAPRPGGPPRPRPGPPAPGGAPRPTLMRRAGGTLPSWLGETEPPAAPTPTGPLPLAPAPRISGRGAPVGTCCCGGCC